MARFYVELLKKDEALWKKNFVQLECINQTDFIGPNAKQSVDLIFSASAKTSFRHLSLLVKVSKVILFYLMKIS